MESFGTKKNARYDLAKRLLDRVVRVIRLVDVLWATPTARHLADQWLRFGTSPGANNGRLQAAQSRKDFNYELGICLREIREARRWLSLIHRVALVSRAKVEPLPDETEASVKTFAASLRTAGKNAS